MPDIETMNEFEMEAVFHDREADPLAFKRWLARARRETQQATYEIASVIAARRLLDHIETECDGEPERIDPAHIADALEICRNAMVRVGPDERLVEIVEALES